MRRPGSTDKEVVVSLARWTLNAGLPGETGTVGRWLEGSRPAGRGRGPTHQVGVLREAPPPSWSRHTARATRVPSRIAWWMPRGATQSPIAWSVGTLPFRAR